jgi:hypothetical protein
MGRHRDGGWELWNKCYPAPCLTLEESCNTKWFSAYGGIRRITVAMRADLKIGDKKMRYRVHRFNIRMTRDQSRLEQFLNSLEGEIVAIIPNITFVPGSYVDFLLIVEKVG